MLACVVVVVWYKVRDEGCETFRRAGMQKIIGNVEGIREERCTAGTCCAKAVEELEAGRVSHVSIVRPALVTAKVGHVLY